MISCLGIVNFEDDRVKIGAMTNFRTIPALSFLGRYRVIDFVLSNMVNSGIDKIELLVKDKPRSLIEHIGGAEQYDINVKHGFLQILYSDNPIANKIYFTDINLLKQYATNIKGSSCDYVVIAPSYMICRIDYQEVLQKHIASKADITCVYKEINDGTKSFIGCHEFEFDGDRIVTNKLSHGSVDEKFISLETYVMSKEMLLKVIEDASNLSPLYSLNDYLAYRLTDLDVRGYRFEGFLRCINSEKEYYKTNMELINYDKAKELFSRNWPIYTRTNDSPPAFYSKEAVVKNSLIANGCVVQGELENCILGRCVKIRKGAKVKNSLILPNAIIGEDAVIENAIVDKHAIVKYVKEIKGTEDDLAYVARREIV